MRIVVTGASGFLGRHLVSALAANGHAGIAVARDPGALHVQQAWTTAAREQMLGSAVLGANCVLHLEVKQHVFNPSARDLAEFDAVNVGGTKEWLDWAGSNGIRRFVYFSSIKAVLPSLTGLTDEFAAGPHPSPYGASKWRAEEAVRQWVKGNPTRGALILRPAVVYGPGNQANVAAMVEAIKRGRFFLIGRNENVKSLISVGNAIAATRHLLAQMQLGTAEIYNLTDRESFSVRELDRRIRTMLGKDGNSPSLPLPFARALALVGDSFFKLTGKSFPINSTRLDALIEPTEFSCAKLLATGFVHPEAALTGLIDPVRTEPTNVAKL